MSPEPIPAAAALAAERPTPPRVGRLIERTRNEIRALLRGEDDRLLVVVGPCSIHDPQAALEYAERLAKVSEQTQGQLVIVMRTYFEKPRTRIGWKGFLSGSGARGLRAARALLVAIHEQGLACGAELLDPMAAPYLCDLLSFGVIGARTVESQTHRELASALPHPIGFKNTTGGNVQTAAHALASAAQSHDYFGVSPCGGTAMLRSPGNPDGCVVLRGGRDGPNYGAEHVARARTLLEAEGGRRVLVDCSHDNSGQDHRNQGRVARNVLGQIVAGERAIMGLLLESHLEPGRQPLVPDQPLEYGVSVTDACIGWTETETLLHEAAEAVEEQR